jgi:YtxH-like protein
MMKASGALWLISGVGIGAGCTYLFATRDGRRLRRRVARMAEDCRSHLAEGGKEMMEGGKELLDKGKALADDAREFIGRGVRGFQH